MRSRSRGPRLAKSSARFAPFCRDARRSSLEVAAGLFPSHPAPRPQGGVIAGGFVPGSLSAWKDGRVLSLQLGENAPGEIGCKLDLPIQFAIAISGVDCG